MTSWFTGGGLGDTLLGLKDKVQSQVNNIDPNLLKKLTLQSDELVSERQRIDEEERRKEAVRETLSEILPWETRDEEMEILVEECKEVILNLSSNDETFTGPFVLPGGLASNDRDGEEADGDADDDDKVADEDENSNRRAAEDLAAAEQSATKLSKLQSLPTLLADFDLDTHVGLIQRMLKVDPKLVGAHSRLSSGGQREVIFWKNYFFHCAYTRYEAGLSIDEIWSNEPRRPASTTNTPTALENDEPSEDFDFVQTAEQSDDGEVVFDSVSALTYLGIDVVGATGGASDAAQRPIVAGATASTSTAFTSTSISPPSTPQRDITYKRSSITNSDSDVELLGSGGADYEFVASGGAGDDGSIDELEAEIAAALGD